MQIKLYFLRFQGSTFYIVLLVGALDVLVGLSLLWLRRTPMLAGTLSTFLVCMGKLPLGLCVVIYEKYLNGVAK